jgi:hypothetical protein
VGYFRLFTTSSPKKLSPKYMLIGLFFPKERERGKRGEDEITRIALGSKQLKALKIALGYFSKHAHNPHTVS